MEIMSIFGIKLDTVLNHLIKYMQAGYSLRSDGLLEFSTTTHDQRKHVLDHFKRLGAEYLKPVSDALNGGIGYEELRLLRLYYLSSENLPLTPPTTNLPTQPFSKQIVCLANSRKYSGRCVAGKEWSGNRVGGWIRPVGGRDTGELSVKETQYKDGKTPDLLDIISVRLTKHSPHSYQTENYLMDEGVWVKKGRFPASDLAGLCDPVDCLWINGYHTQNGLNDRMPRETVEEQLKSSLLFIKPDNVVITVEEGANLLKKVRSRFSFAGEEYLLQITDPLIESRFFLKDIGDYPIDEKNIYLTISISEPYKGFCYKLVAGVLNLFENV